MLQHYIDSPIAKAQDNAPGLFTSWANVQAQEEALWHDRVDSIDAFYEEHPEFSISA
jgi:hypothetical protein